MLGKLRISKINGSSPERPSISMAESSNTDQKDQVEVSHYRINCIKSQEEKNARSLYVHSEFILNGLQILKSNNILCDVVLIAEGFVYFLIFCPTSNAFIFKNF